MGLDGRQFVQAVPVTLDGGRLIAAPTHKGETVCVPICTGGPGGTVGAAISRPLSGIPDPPGDGEPCGVSSTSVGAGPRPARVPSRKISQDPLNPTGFPFPSVGAAISRPLTRVTGPAGERETVWGFVPGRRGRCPHRPVIPGRQASPDQAPMQEHPGYFIHQVRPPFWYFSCGSKKSTIVLPVLRWRIKQRFLAPPGLSVPLRS